MQKIIVNIDLLKAKLLEAEKEGMKSIELYIVPSQMEEGHLYPTFLHVEGISKDGNYKDYESIDEFSVSEHLLTEMSA